MKLIKRTPISISGVSLALAALGNLLSPYFNGTVRNICGLFSAALLILFIARLALDWESVKNELKNPVPMSILPTSTMALMLLCGYVKPYWGSAVVVIWYAALVAHVLIMLLFAWRFVLGFKLQNVFPSWFVALVGVVVASVTSPAMNAASLGRVIFFAGLVLYVVILPVIIYRMAKTRPLPEPARPVIAIFTAPVSLCLVGYLSAFEHPSVVPVCVMLTVAALSYIYVTVNMVFLLRLKFYPTYAAFTFPYVISAVAFKQANAFLQRNGYDFFAFVPRIAEWVAIAVVAYVVIRFARFIAVGK